MITVNNESVEVLIEDKKFDLPFLWLRDNCQCDECRITETQEKQFLLHTVPIDISPDKVDMDGDMLLIKWPDGHDSIIPISKILECGASRYPDYKFWSKKFTPNRFTWKDFLDDVSTSIEALKDLVSYGVIILKEAPKELNSLEMLSKRLGPIHETLFERIHNVSVTGHVYNVAHTSKGLPPHNDFASYKSQPSIQALHMLEN